MFSSVCSSPQRGFCVEAHKLFRHVDAKISHSAGSHADLTLVLWPGVGSHLVPPLWSHPVAAQLCSWGVPTHEECDRVVLELLCKELLSPVMHHSTSLQF